MKKVATCVNKLPELLNALKAEDFEQLQSLCEEISNLEHEADKAKEDIRKNIPGKLFFSVPKAQFLEMVNTQDALADAIEDISVLLTLKKLKIPEPFKEPTDRFVAKNLEAFAAVYNIIEELPELIESSFGGIEAEKVRLLIHEVATLEHEADVIQRDLLKSLLNNDDKMSPGTFYLWQKTFHEIGMLSNLSEKLSQYIYMMLETR